MDMKLKDHRNHRTVTMGPQSLRVGTGFRGVVVHHQPVKQWSDPPVEGLPPPVDAVLKSDSSLLSNQELRDMQAEFGANLGGEGPIPDYLSEDFHEELQVTSLHEILEDLTI